MSDYSAFGPCLGDQLRERARIEGRIGASVSGGTRHRYKPPSDLQSEAAAEGVTTAAIGMRKLRARRKVGP
jgi:hypothetical protein